MDILNYIFGLVQTLVGNQGMGRILFILLIAIAVFTFCLAIFFLLSWIFRPEKGRLRELGTAAVTENKQASSMERILASSGERAPSGSAASRTRYQNMLVMAGYHGTGALFIFYGIRLLAMILLPIATMFLTGFVLKLAPYPVILFTVAALIVGLVLPALILEKQMKGRQKDLRRGLPDALDLLVVCTEAGLGLKASLQRVANDLYISHPDLGDELAQVNAETRVGIDNVTALKNLADRTGVAEMRSLVAALSQSIRFGTNLAETLRIYSDELRDKRLQTAEEAAAMVSTKMLFPLVLCIFPSFFVVALGPPFLGALNALAATGRF